MRYREKNPARGGNNEERRASRDHMRAFGQNFLRSDAVALRIVDFLGPLDRSHVLELGAGPGRLTRCIVERAARTTLVELDRTLAGALRQMHAADERVVVIEGDILRLDFEAWADGCAPLTPLIAGNIPYNITKPLLFKLFDSHRGLGDVVLMLQEEVARKLTAPPGGKPYGMVSVLAAYYADAEYLFPVGRDNFSPRPKVDSAVVRLGFGRGDAPRAADESLFRALVKRLFLERRKQVQKILRSDPLYRLQAGDLEALGREAGVDLESRPECLSVGDFVRLSDSLDALRAGRAGGDG